MTYGLSDLAAPVAPFGDTVATSAVRITPNRRQVDRRFPSLGFTIDGGGLPFYEVLLTTDRALFDPANAGRRTAANFYASRQDSGLLRTEGGSTVYLAPTAVLRAFAGNPAVFYTAIAYGDERGNGAAFAQPVETLPANAPSVALSPDLKAQSLSSVLSVPLERIVHTRTNGTSFGLALGAAQGFAASDDDAGNDAAEGEDGYGRSAGLGFAESDDGDDDDGERQYGTYGLSDDATGDDAAGDSYASELEADSTQAPPPSSIFAADDNDGYDDGFAGTVRAADAGDDAVENDDYGGQVAPAKSAAAFSRGAGNGSYADEADIATAQSSTFPSGAATPAMLWDDDEEGETSHETSHATSLADTPSYESLEGPTPSPTAPAAPAAPRTLQIADMRDIVSAIAPFESGGDGYAAINADGEFAGRFGASHPATGRYHVGLSYGVIQFTQDSGSLGQLLTRMRDRDTAQFDAIFGANAADLIRVTNAPGPSSSQSPNGRSARVQPVAGADLWVDPWAARFRRAGAHVPFQAAQNELAAEMYLRPMLPFAAWLGLDSFRALAMVFDRSVQMGAGGARQWIIEAVGPVQTTAQRQQVLTALGHADLRAFQAATTGLTADGQWGANTHAAMVAGLRRLAARSPIPIPTRDQMLDAMERRASTTAWSHRVRQLRHSPTVRDDVFAL